MATVQSEALAELYEQDETAWLEIMAQLCARKQYADLDLVHLAQYLADTARSERREVLSRLTVLMWHLLKWEHQPDMQTGSWAATIDQQRFELRVLLESATPMNHALQILAAAYATARKRAAKETGLKLGRFPKECPWHIEELLADD
ncbi:MAG: DUF29 domain-containing protein [Planctomycetes bacterium]|nr:DUF29 domain-containing protein [Planctomycetota bacterium]